MTRSEVLERLQPWAGLVVGPTAWYLHQRGVGDALSYDCAHGRSPAALAGTLLAFAALFAAGYWSWRFWRAQPRNAEPSPHAFLALVGAGAAGIFGLALVFQALAMLLVPECAR